MDLNPYSTDAILEETTGSHLGWTAGIFFDKYEKVNWVCRTTGGEFNGTGEGSVDFPGSWSPRVRTVRWMPTSRLRSSCPPSSA